MKNIITLLLALSLLLGACALADDRADMLVAAAVNELGYSRDKGRIQQIRRVGRQRLRRMVLGVCLLVREFRR